MIFSKFFRFGLWAVLVVTLFPYQTRLMAGTTFVTSQALNGFSNVFCSISSNGYVTPINIDQSAFAAYGLQAGMAVDATGNLYVAYSGDAIVKFTTNTASLFASNNGAPSQLCFDNLGNLYGNSNDCVIQITTNEAIIYASGLSGLNSFCFDKSGNLYASTGSQISKISRDGGIVTFATAVNFPPLNSAQSFIAIAIDGESNVQVCVSYDYNFSYSFFTLNPDGIITDQQQGLRPIGIGSNIAADETTNIIYSVENNAAYGIAVIGPFGFIEFPKNAASSIFVAYTPLNEILGVYSPKFEIQPNAQTRAAGSAVIFNSAAVGSLPIKYQWFFDQTNLIAGATNTMLTLTNVTSDQSGQYTLVASNYLGTATSQPGELDILPSLNIVTVPALMIYGGIGFTYNVQYINQIGPTNAPWMTLATVTLTNSPQYYPDYSALGQPVRFYRTVQVQ